MQAQQLLKDVFGFDDFRPLQKQVIEKIIAGEDVLLILPTGGGKSLCYQLPALLMPGVLVVISPLLALMQDQVYGLESKGIKAAMMSSMQRVDELHETERQVQNGEIKIIFVAPERLQNEYFLHFLTSINITFFAIDEAHCVSEWGHEFRADYRQLGLLKERFPQTNIAAFTATATTQVEKDIVKQLRFKQANNVVRGRVYRDNLSINAQMRQTNGRVQLLEFLAKHPNQQGIIYASSRAKTDSLNQFLCENNFKTSAYHAGFDSQKRQIIFQDFVNENIDIIVATIAFGMGIDKSNIRFVVHTSLPKTMEAYYQEIGRAGRDGLLSEVFLLYSSADLAQQQRFIREIENANYRQLAYDKLETIKKYAFSEKCRHQMLSAYFDDTMDACQTVCDNCLNPDTKRDDISELAKKFLSTIYRTKQLFGKNYIIEVLRGSKNKRILANEHEQLSVYGIGVDTSKSQWHIIADRLFEIDALAIEGEYGSLKLTKKSKGILKSLENVDIAKSRFELNKTTGTSAKNTNDYEVDDNIFQALRALRKQIAADVSMPAYIIFDDKTLKEMAYSLPDTKEKFLNIHGVGEIKFNKYGEQFLSLLTTFTIADCREPQRDETSSPSEDKAQTQTQTQTLDENTSSLPSNKTSELSQTYHTTLSLIEQGLSVDDISENRKFTTSTILGHINKLVENNWLDDEKRRVLFAQIPSNQAIDDWIQQGIELTGSLQSMSSYLAIFRQLNPDND